MRLPVILSLLAGLWTIGCSDSRSAQPQETAAIRQVLLDQVEAWNRGDLAGFMDGYWQSDSLRFASGGSVRYGWQTTLDRYRRAYPDRAAMGTLAFDSLNIRVIDAENAYVFGRWSLARDTTFAPASGLFTLFLRRLPDGWRIAHDHTSATD